MGSVNSWFWKHAYLLQFTDKNNRLKDAFAFSMPPESESIQTTQRVSYTKTFGGVVVDDYGNDVTKISLSGTTGNKDLKVIYRGMLGKKNLTGEQEILYLNDLIKKYGKYYNLNDKKIWLYDLSKTAGKSLVSSTKNYWRVFIDSFKYSRDKSMPLSYKYQLELTAIDEEKKNSISDKFSKIKSFIETMEELTENAIALANAIQNSVGSVIAEIENYKSVLTQTIGTFKECYASYSNLVQGIVENTGGIIDEVTNLGDYVINDTVREIQDSTINLYVAAKDVCEACKNLSDSAKEGINNETYEGQWEQLLNEYDIDSKDTLSDLVFKIAEKIKDTGFFINANTKEQIEVSSKDGVTYYGTVEHTVEQNETFESISIKYYKTADYADLLQSLNGITETETSIVSCGDIDSGKIEVGTVIKIPILKESDLQVFEGIIKSQDDTDILGKDIELTDSGDFATENGDLTVTHSTDTVNQAIVSRLATETGTKIRDTAYGIKAEIGDSQAINAYLTASIENTILEDERIESVDSIEYSGTGDNLAYEVTYTTKNDKQNMISGVI